MKRRRVIPFLFTVLILAVLTMAGCGLQTYAKSGTEIINASKALKMLEDPQAVLVDAQAADAYTKQHIEGAVSIPRASIVVNKPFSNMLAPAGQIELVLGRMGISNDTTIVVYDSNKNMDAARLWWTAKVYGHENIKVVSGGLQALIDAGASISTEVTTPAAATYTAQAANEDWIADKEAVLAQVQNPQKRVKLLDTRTTAEYEEGTIPGSILVDYASNNNQDNTFKTVRQIRVLYQQNGILPKDTVIMYCKTSIRGAESFLALYDAGYRNLKLYDGAWIEWSSESDLPKYIPGAEGEAPAAQDAS